MNNEKIINHFSSQLERLHPRMMENYENGDLKKGHTIFVLSESYLKLGICAHFQGDKSKASINFLNALETFKQLITEYNANPSDINIGLISHVITWPYELAYLSDDMESIKWLQSNWPLQAEDECTWYRTYQEFLADMFLGNTNINQKRIDNLKKQAFTDVLAQTDLLCSIAIADKKAICESWLKYKKYNDKHIKDEWADGLPSVLSIDGTALFELTKEHLDVAYWPSEENYRFHKS
ncbi:hypothetical protein [Neptuniibacter sp. QD57_21]|uniref:hypothetical protein n=1 Tax=Neptuniibacter sp. QD57_21 TaxID=3398213 RepID=UPI0039F4FC7B